MLDDALARLCSVSPSPMLVPQQFPASSLNNAFSDPTRRQAPRASGERETAAQRQATPLPPQSRGTSRGIADMENVEGSGQELVTPLVALLNRYKTTIDLELVFDSDDDFLYRQKDN